MGERRRHGHESGETVQWKSNKKKKRKTWLGEELVQEEIKGNLLDMKNQGDMIVLIRRLETKWLGPKEIPQMTVMRAMRGVKITTGQEVQEKVLVRGREINHRKEVQQESEDIELTVL